MIQFNPISRSIIPELDLNILRDTSQRLQQGHLDAIKFGSELKTAVAQWDLHADEDAWKAGKVNEIENTIKDNMEFGNAYSSLDNLIAKSGNLVSDPAFIGRYRANQEYKKFNTELNARQDLTERDKERFRQQNKYHYEDKYDQNGNVIGGSTWEPNKRASIQIADNLIFQESIKIAAKEAGGGSSYRFVDENGNVTRDLNKAVDALVMNQSSSKYERLGKDKIMKAVDAAIQMIPGARESLKQKYETEKWYYDRDTSNGNPTDSDILDDNGLILTEKEWIKRKFEGAAHVASYNHVFSDTNISQGFGLAAYKKSLEASYQGSQLQEQQNIQLPTSQGEAVAIKIDPYAENRGRADDAFGKFTTLLKDKYKDKLTFKGALQFYSNNQPMPDSTKIMRENGVSEDDIKLLEMYRAEYNNSINNINKMNKGVPDNIIQGRNLLNDIDQGLPISKNNIHNKEINKVINKVFEGNTNIRFRIKDNKMYSDLLSYFGGVEEAKNRGIVIDESSKTITIGDDDKNMLPLISEQLYKSLNSNSSWFSNFIYGGETNNAISNYFSVEYDSPSKSNDNPNKSYTQMINVLDVGKNINSIRKDIVRYNKNKYNGSDKKEVLYTGKNYDGTSLQNARDNQLAYMTGDDKDVKKATISSKADKSVLASADLHNMHIWRIGSDNVARSIVNDGEKTNMTNLLKQHINSDNTIMNAMPVPGKPGMVKVTIKPILNKKDRATYGYSISKENEDKEIIETFLIDTGDNSQFARQMRSNPDYIKNMKVSELTQNGEEEYVYVPNGHGINIKYKGRNGTEQQFEIRSANNKTIVNQDNVGDILEAREIVREFLEYKTKGANMSKEYVLKAIESQMILMSMSNIYGDDDIDVLQQDAISALGL